jgi:phosphohistidine phosphatase
VNASPRLAVLVRHAHAEWPSYAGRDFDRPLTPRGLADARLSGVAIREAALQPDAVLVSPALRTRQTAEVIARELALPAGVLRFIDDLYNAPVETLESRLREAAADRRAVMLIAHNPGISELARLLAREPKAPFFAPAQWRTFDLDQM